MDRNVRAPLLAGEGFVEVEKDAGEDCVGCELCGAGTSAEFQSGHPTFADMSTGGIEKF